MTTSTSRAKAPTAPAGGGATLVPDSELELDRSTRAIYVGIGGTLAVEMESGETLSFLNVPDGALLPIRIRRVLSGTTATALIGLQ